VQVPASVRDKASAPQPPASAKTSTSIGKGKASANTANSASDTDSVWEELDFDGDGNVEQTSLLWDDEDRVLYMYSDDPFTCRNGGTGDGNMLVAVYGKGNTYKKPAGSGWYVAELDKSECAAQAAGIYGCKFDANGNATACGVAVVDDKNDDIVIATSTTPTLTMARPVRQGR
ncbi:MAG: hypothetical protein ACRD1B_02035, partial [Thermoanaerobaculia bacterium]